MILNRLNKSTANTLVTVNKLKTNEDMRGDIDLMRLQVNNLYLLTS